MSQYQWLIESRVRKLSQEQYKAANDFISRWFFSGSDSEARNKLMAETLEAGLNNYICEMLKVVELLATPEQQQTAVAFLKLTSAVTHDSTGLRFAGITKDAVTALHTQNRITTTQALFLYHAAHLNTILQILNGLYNKGLGHQDNILNALELISEINNFSAFLVDVSKQDSDSFRVFQILNFNCKAGLTKEWWQTLFKEQKIDATVQQTIHDIFTGLAPKSEGEVYAAQQDNAVSLMKDRILSEFIALVEKGAEDIFQLENNIVDNIIPSFLSIHTGHSDLIQVKMLINELLPLEESQGFLLTSDYFAGWVAASNSGQVHTQVLIKQEIAEYIARVRVLREQRGRGVDLLVESKATSLRLNNVAEKLVKLKREELDNTRLIKKKHQVTLVDLFQKKAPEFKSFLARKIEATKIVDLSTRKLVLAALDILDDKESIATAISLAFEKNSVPDGNSRLKYYDAAFEQARKKSTISASAIITRLDDEYVYISSLIKHSHDVTSILTSEGGMGAVFKLFNPLGLSINKIMPFDLAYRLKTLHEIEAAIPVITRFIDQNISLKEHSHSLSVRRAYSRVEKQFDELKLKHRELKKTILVDYLIRLENLIAHELEELSEADKKATSSLWLPLHEDKRVERENHNIASTILLRNKISEIKAILQNTNNIYDARLNTYLMELAERIKQTEKTCDVSLNVLADDLKRLTGYFGGDDAQKQAAITRLNNKTRYKADEGWIPWGVKFARYAILIYDALKSVVRWVQRVMASAINLLLYPFAQIYRHFSRLRTNNQKLMQDLQSLEASVMTFNIAYSDKYKVETQKLLARIAWIKDKVGRVSYAYHDLRFNKFDSLQKEFNELQMISKDAANQVVSMTDNAVVSTRLVSVADTGNLSEAELDNIRRMIDASDVNGIQQECYKRYIESLDSVIEAKQQEIENLISVNMSTDSVEPVRFAVGIQVRVIKLHIELIKRHHRAAQEFSAELIAMLERTLAEFDNIKKRIVCKTTSSSATTNVVEPLLTKKSNQEIALAFVNEFLKDFSNNIEIQLALSNAWQKTIIEGPGVALAAAAWKDVGGSRGVFKVIDSMLAQPLMSADANFKAAITSALDMFAEQMFKGADISTACTATMSKFAEKFGYIQISKLAAQKCSEAIGAGLKSAVTCAWRVWLGPMGTQRIAPQDIPGLGGVQGIAAEIAASTSSQTPSV